MTDATQSDWPEHVDELSRKTLETLDFWVGRVDRGEAKKRDLYVIVSALWDATAGLVRKDVMRTLEYVHEELRREARRKSKG